MNMKKTKKTENQISDLQGEPLYLNVGNLWNRFSRPFRLAFVSTFFLGFIMHLYVFSNLLLNHDGIYFIGPEGMGALHLGRWSVNFFSFLSWIYETPVVIAVVALLALSICAGLTVCILKIHSSLCIFLVSGFMVSFPTVACSFSYMFMADAFFIAALLHIAAVYITRKYRYGWCAAILCIAVGLGIYQSYIGCTVALFLFDCILLLFSDKSIKTVLKRGVAYIAIILAGLVLYRVILACLLWKNHTVLGSYRNMNEAINSGVFDYLRILPLSYRQIFEFFWSPSYLIRPLQILQRVIFILAAGCFLFLAVLKRIYKDPLRLFLLSCGAVLLPVALNLICIICGGWTDVNMLMQYSYVFAFVFAIKLFELTALEIQILHFRRTGYAVVLTSLVVCATLVWSNFCICNTAYLEMQLTMEISQSLGIRVLSKLEALNGYVPGETPVMLVENTSIISKIGKEFPQLTSMTGFMSFMLSDYAGQGTLRYLCGESNFLKASEEQRVAISSSGVVDSMPVFPAKDSIQIYDGVVIIKI